MLKFENKLKKGLYIIKRVVYLLQLKTQTLKIEIMKAIVATFENTGKVNTHYFNGYGFTNKTKQVKEKLESKGLVNGVDFEIKNFIGEKTRTKIVKIYNR